MLLGLLGVTDDVIVVDYVATRENLDAIIDRLMASKGYRAMLSVLPPETLHADPETMIYLLERIRAQYGSIREYALSAGVAEQSIESLEGVTRKIIETEERARERMMRDARIQIEDKVWRAYGSLRFCRSIHSREVINLCSAVRLGTALGVPGICPLHVVNELLVLTQPAHLQRLYGGDLTPAERNVFRAQLVRERLAAAEGEPGRDR